MEKGFFLESKINSEIRSHNYFTKNDVVPSLVEPSRRSLSLVSGEGWSWLHGHCEVSLGGKAKGKCVSSREGSKHKGPERKEHGLELTDFPSPAPLLPDSKVPSSPNIACSSIEQVNCFSSIIIKCSYVYCFQIHCKK